MNTLFGMFAGIILLSAPQEAPMLLAPLAYTYADASVRPSLCGATIGYATGYTVVNHAIDLDYNTALAVSLGISVAGSLLFEAARNDFRLSRSAAGPAFASLCGSALSVRLRF